MRSNLGFFILIFSSSIVFSQSKRNMIMGKIKSDIGSVENIHVINKNTYIATISDSEGTFQIPVKENDTLFFSAIQFAPKNIIINKTHLENYKLIITLELKINTLDEAVITQPKNMAKGLGLPNAGKKPLNKLESRLNYHARSSLARVFLSILLNEKGNINDIYYITSGKRKNDRRLQQKISDDQNNQFQEQEILKIRAYFKDDFFTKTLQIPASEIVYFIKYCDEKDALYLFQKKRYLEVIDLFIKESKPYLQKLVNEE